MALDLYQRLGLKRGASEAEIKTTQDVDFIRGRAGTIDVGIEMPEPRTADKPCPDASCVVQSSRGAVGHRLLATQVAGVAQCIERQFQRHDGPRRQRCRPGAASTNPLSRSIA